MWWYVLLVIAVGVGSFGALWAFAQEEARTEELRRPGGKEQH